MSVLGKALAGAAVGMALSAASNLMSLKRAANLPKGGETGGGKSPAQAKSGDNNADWRVRLSIPPIDLFTGGDDSGLWTIKPLIDAGGLIFPYTPTISISHSASYSESSITHQNYQFITYQNSKVSDITIVADFAVEDAEQAQYWLAAVHFLRTVTKMFTGDTPGAGSPPPILLFNAYGDFVFKNVPVVVKSFNVTLPKDVDYIKTNMKFEQISSDPTGSLDSGNPTNKLNLQSMLQAGVVSALGNTTAGKIGAGLIGAANRFGKKPANSKQAAKSNSASQDGDSHVPTQSSLTVTIMPVYSRTKVREFNLKNFVDGAYVKDGYI